MSCIGLSGNSKVLLIRHSQRHKSRRPIAQAMCVLDRPSSLSLSIKGGGTIGQAKKMELAPAICAATFDVRCRAQTQTVGRPSINVSSAPGKEELPKFDHGGSGFNGTGIKSYYRGDDSDGTGGGDGGPGSIGGGFSWGDFWFYIFLCYLMHMVNKIIEDMKRLKEKARLEEEEEEEERAVAAAAAY
ncbi:hypothetical protein GIB67_023136 [Kingdonia uniflora]|uniref:Uncharacterized protein n=1 Tax=Kingdonia uniflora TaxID=39325 RepID=A0A7J7M5K9_9MAGN|nr:hypothetical protein GIB67_023136 [Kingdonia uniflora]